MGKKDKAKERLDKFYHLAKEQGFRSRSAFKLVQINRQFDFLSGCHALLDLCAAPGGWLQVAQQHLPVGSTIVGVDTAPIRPIRGVITLTEDITSDGCKNAIKRATNGVDTFDVVLHDGAPNVGGAWAKDAYEQSTLTLDALRLATQVLAPRGTFVTKVFRSSEYTSLLFAFNKLFDNVKPHKPKSSRHESAEIFLVCSGYKAPSKIDSRLLDHRHLFADVDHHQPGGTSKKRARSYEEGTALVEKRLPADEFVRNDKPADMLGNYTSIVFTQPRSDEGVDEQRSKDLDFIRNHKETTREIMSLCDDLRLLNRADFKYLIRWRSKVRKDLLTESVKEEKKESGVDEKAASEEGAQEGNDQEQLLARISEAHERAKAREKKERRRERKLQEKAKLRQAQGSAAKAGMGYEDEGDLFNLGQIPSADHLREVTDAEVPSLDRPEDQNLERAKLRTMEQGGDIEEEDVYNDEDDERIRADELEENVDMLYKQYKERHPPESSSNDFRRKRLKLQPEELTGASESAGDDGQAQRKGGKDPLSRLPDTRKNAAANPLLVDGEQTDDAKAQDWFDQDIFRDAGIELEDEVDDGPLKAEGTQHVGDEAGDSADGNHGRKKRDTEAEWNDADVRASDENGRGASKKADHGDEGFEVVEREQRERTEGQEAEGEETDSADELPEREKAVMRAMGMRMQTKRGRDEMEDEAYNRWNVEEDEEDLPEWFREEERKFMRPQMPVSGSEVRDAQEALRRVDDKPIKKVAEARARRKRHERRQLQKAKARAEAVSGSGELAEHTKRREIERIYSSAMSSKGQSNAKRGKSRPVDRRMKKDAPRGGRGSHKKGASSKPGGSRAKARRRK